MMNALAAMVLLAALSAPSPPGEKGEDILLEGGGAAISGTFAVLHPDFESDTGISLHLKETTVVESLIDVADGKVDAATAAVPLETILAEASARGITVDPTGLVVQEIGENRIQAFTHLGTAVSRLTRTELKGIFTGRIRNWNEVGGADLPITIVWGARTCGQNRLFSSMILDGEPVRSDAVTVSDYASIRDTVAAIPGAIGIDPRGFMTANVNTPEIPPLVTPIIVITKGQPSPKVAKLLDYYREELAYLQDR